MEPIENLISKFAQSVRDLSSLLGQEIRVQVQKTADNELQTEFYTVLIEAPNIKKSYHFPVSGPELIIKTTPAKVFADLTYPNLMRSYPGLEKVINKNQYQQMIEKALNPPKPKKA